MNGLDIAASVDGWLSQVGDTAVVIRDPLLATHQPAVVRALRRAHALFSLHADVAGLRLVLYPPRQRPRNGPSRPAVERGGSEPYRNTAGADRLSWRNKHRSRDDARG
ncbi:MAG: hypothetical protein AB1716_04215 [Planctomycetota bacterium]